MSARVNTASRPRVRVDLAPRPRVRVDLVAPPMSGHLHPTLGIARRLARDVDVRVISTPAALPEIAAAGVPGHAMRSGDDNAIAAIVNPPHAVGHHPLRLHRQFTANLALLGGYRRELLNLWQHDPPALVLADFAAPVAGSAALALGIPWWTTLRQPCAVETPDGPPGYLGGWRPMPGPMGDVRDAAGRTVVRAFKQLMHRLHRRALIDLGFQSVYLADGYEAMYSPERILALGLAELEFPRTLPARLTFVGPVLYTPPTDAEPPPFVDGRRHVLITLGTHLPWRRDAVASAIRDAARALPDVEFHVSDGDRASHRRESQGNVHRLGFVSYARDLARYDVIVHHAGAGVLFHALSEGKPSVLLPSDYDQFDNAARLEHIGAGVRARRLPELARHITTALDDQTMRSRCRRLEGVIGAERAEDRVAELLLDRLHRRELHEIDLLDDGAQRVD
ncbi:MAG: glycosyl transferase [Acidobacteria bacterium]|nr:glycosyl transferase [Acidobacteriota bacterium]